MLRFVDDTTPGITRRRRGRYWIYFDAEGNRITDRDEIDRLNAIGLPPAYERAWLCPIPNGHIQATGYDARGRKQYRYHPDFRASQEAAKFDRCACFGEALPRLRRRVAQDLEKKAVSREAVVAAVVRLLDHEHLRVGNETYAKSNKSFGATTLRSRHVSLLGRAVKMRFKGKSGIERELTVTDRTLARIVRRCMDLPGQHLFQYIDDEGETQPVSSTDVNDYIREVTGEELTAKHFRTWAASVIAFERLCTAGEEGISVKDMLEPVAQALGNTPAISRKSYVHPALIEAVTANPRRPLGELPCPPATAYLSSAERGFLLFLESEAKTDGQRKKAA